jgi:hypothetical protein
MNKSIKEVALNSTNERVRELTRKLFDLAGRRVRISFVKKNGEIRIMDCVPNVQYNATFGIKSCERGINMVRAKVANDMITVAEIVGNMLRPRTINLRTVIGDIEELAC